MTHETRVWAGYSAAADTDEESDVVGHPATAIVNERRVASSKFGLPRCESVKSHTSTQVLFAPLCHACIAGRDREVPQPSHLGATVSVSGTTPMESLENLFTRLKDSTFGEGQETTRISEHSWFFVVKVLLMITQQTEPIALKRSPERARLLWRKLWKFPFCQLTRFRRGWFDIRVASEYQIRRVIKWQNTV